MRIEIICPRFMAAAENPINTMLFERIYTVTTWPLCFMQKIHPIDFTLIMIIMIFRDMNL